MKTQTTNNTTPTTKDILQDLMSNRNDNIIKGFTDNLQNINTELITTIAQIATYKTLKFLQANNATTGTETETTDNGQKNSFGFDLSIKFLATLTRDIKVLETQNTDEIITDAFDLVQIASETITPYFQSNAIFTLSDTVYTKTLKNGNEKNYTIFSLACKGIREYITAQQQRQYKKLSYSLGYTDNGTEILTTKKPKNDITDTTETDRTNLLNKYNLTTQEQTALLYLFDGLNTTETAEKMQVSKRTIERALKSAREKIQATEKRIRL
jgi:predicted DNA-binding protein (UPF0251 family)